MSINTSSFKLLISTKIIIKIYPVPILCKAKTFSGTNWYKHLNMFWPPFWSRKKVAIFEFCNIFTLMMIQWYINCCSLLLLSFCSWFLQLTSATYSCLWLLLLIRLLTSASSLCYYYIRSNDNSKDHYSTGRDVVWQISWVSRFFFTHEAGPKIAIMQ
jgi:hypothetical protein